MMEEREHFWKRKNRMSKVWRLEEVQQVQGTSRCDVENRHELSWRSLPKARVSWALAGRLRYLDFILKINKI